MPVVVQSIHILFRTTMITINDLGLLSESLIIIILKRYSSSTHHCQSDIFAVISSFYASVSYLIHVERRSQLSKRYYFNDHLLKNVRNFATRPGHCLLWPEATTFLNHSEAYSWPYAAAVVCGRRPQSLMTHKSGLPLGQMVTLVITKFIWKDMGMQFY